MSKRISVIIAAYNSMDCIYDAIESVLRQDYGDVELIICDDASGSFDADEIKAYIEKHKGTGLRAYDIYSNEQNLGTVKNLNKAIARSHGEIITEIGSDDMFYNARVLSDIASSMECSGAEFMLMGRAAFRDTVDDIIETLPAAEDREKIMAIESPAELRTPIFSGTVLNIASGCAWAYTRALFEGIGGYDEAYLLLEDAPFIAKYLASGKMPYRNYELISVYYRLGGVSTGKISPKMKADMLRLLQTGLDDASITGFDKRMIRHHMYCMANDVNENRGKKWISRVMFPDVSAYNLSVQLRRRLHGDK